LGDADFLEELIIFKRHHPSQTANLSSPGLTERIRVMCDTRCVSGRAEASSGECWPWDEAEPGLTLLIHDIETRNGEQHFEPSGCERRCDRQAELLQLGAASVHVPPVHQWAKRQPQDFGTGWAKQDQFSPPPLG